MLGLGQPSLWFLLLFTAIPIIIHLIQRYRLKKQAYSSLFFLTESKRETFSWFKLKEILLLVLRTFFIFFLLLSLLKPYIRSRTQSGPTWATRIIILDDSYSMGYGTTFLKAKQSARSLISQLKKNSKSAVITSSGKVKTELTNNLTGLMKLIDTIAISYSHATLQSAFENAVNIANNEPAEIYIITDLQARALAPIIRYIKDMPQQMPITIIDCGNATTLENVGIVDLTLSPSLITADISSKPKLSLKNYSFKNQKRKVALTVSGKAETDGNQTIESRQELVVETKPKETKEIIFDYEINKPGQYRLKAEAEADSLRFDDVCYWTITVADKVPLLLLYENENDIYYVERALRQGNFDVTTSPFKTLSKINLKGYKAIGLFSPTNLSYADWQRIRSYLQDGGGLFISFNNEITEKRWPMILGLDLESSFLADGSTQVSATGFWTIGQIDTLSPILEVFSKNDLSSAKFFSYYQPKEQKHDENVLARFSTGSPFLIMPKERCIVALSKFDINTTNFMFKAQFLPLFHRIFSYLTLEKLKPAYFVGDTIRLTDKADFFDQPLKIFLNQKQMLIPDSSGFWSLGNNTLAVNVFPDEGDLSRIDVKLLKDAKVKVINNIEGKITDLSLLSFFFAVLFFLLELVLLVV
ncbi:MAG: BatA and WFA domain-containing protein [candidate division WOR-3 bacterium]